MSEKFKIQEISAAELDDFYRKFEGEKTFLQASKFGEFRETLGEKNVRLGIFWNQKLVGTAQFQQINARRGRFLHVPHGPLIEREKLFDEALFFFLEEIKQWGRSARCSFVRVSPLLDFKTKSTFQKSNFRAAPLHINPDRTWILDLTQSEEKILENMRKSTRYEIRRIEKTDIEIKMGNSEKDLDIFWKLHQETVTRQGFSPFPRKSTEKELKIFGTDCQIFSAKIGGEYFASSIILFDAISAYYHQGASVYSKAPVAHATLWTAILEAKKRGCKFFNFWGVSPEEKKKHPWTGLSQFKRGFGGIEKSFLPAQDCPLSGKYWFNWIVESVRRWKRNY